MDLLLDTHAIIWYSEGNAKLSKASLKLIEEPDNLKFVSIVSLWEIVIKSSQNKTGFIYSVEDIHDLIKTNGFILLDITIGHLLLLQTLPHHHGDPFDRLLIAQAITEDLIIISADRHFDPYPVNVSW